MIFVIFKKLEYCILKFLRFVVPLKECPVAIQTFVFKLKPPFFTVNYYLVDNFLRNLMYRNKNSNEYLLIKMFVLRIIVLKNRFKKV